MKKILGIGNALVDILVKLNNDETLCKLNLPKGSMQLIDQSTMLRICDAISTYTQHTATGGSTSNTSVALARLGCQVGFIGKVGNDTLGAFYSDDLTNNGVTPHLLKSNLPSGRCNVLISTDSERTMATYLGAAVTLNADDLNIDIFRQYDILHIEGYLVQNYDLISHAGQLAKEAGLIVSIDLASYNIVAENIDFLQDFVDKSVDIVPDRIQQCQSAADALRRTLLHLERGGFCRVRHGRELCCSRSAGIFRDPGRAERHDSHAVLHRREQLRSGPGAGEQGLLLLCSA